MVTDSSVVMARGKQGRGWIEVGKECKMWSSVIVTIIKIKI